MTTSPTADRQVPDGFVDAVMRRVSGEPCPMPARSFWSAVADRSAIDIVGSLTVAWRLVVRGGAVPVMIRAQALALIVLLTISVAGSSALAAAAAYRSVAPLVFPPSTPFSVVGPTPRDEPDVTARPSPVVSPHRPAVGPALPGVAEPDPTPTPPTDEPAMAPPRDPEHHAESEPGDGEHKGAHGDRGSGGDDASDHGDRGGGDADGGDDGDEHDGDGGEGGAHPSDDGGTSSDSSDDGTEHSGGDTGGGD